MKSSIQRLVLLNTEVTNLEGPSIQCIRSTSVSNEREVKAILSGTGSTETRHPPNCQKGKISDGFYITLGGKGLYSGQVSNPEPAADPRTEHKRNGNSRQAE